MFEGLVRFFAEGGTFMWLILVIMSISVAIIVERMLLLMRWRINAVGLWHKVRDLVAGGHAQDALSLCKKSEAPLPKVFTAGLRNLNTSERKIQNAVDEVMLEVIPELEKRTGHLTILANVSTLCGLLGTIFGLRKAFVAVAVADPAQKAGILARGISEALNATAFGLLVAVLALLSYSYLQSTIAKIIDEIDQFSVKFINLLVEGGRSDGTKTVS